MSVTERCTCLFGRTCSPGLNRAFSHCPRLLLQRPVQHPDRDDSCVFPGPLNRNSPKLVAACDSRRGVLNALLSISMIRQVKRASLQDCWEVFLSLDSRCAREREDNSASSYLGGWAQREVSSI